MQAPAPQGQPGPYGQQQPGHYGQQPGPYGQGQPDPYGQQPGPYGPGQPDPYGPPAHPGMAQGYVQPHPGAAPVPLTADGVPLAGWGWRLLAIMIDGLLLTVLTYAAGFPILVRMIEGVSNYMVAVIEWTEGGAAGPQPLPQAYLNLNDQYWLALIGAVVGMAFNVLFLKLKQATPGKMAVGLRVVPVDQGRAQHQALSWQQAVIRSAIWVLPSKVSIGGLFQLLDGLFPLWQPKRQALHDMGAKTQVVKIR